MYVWGGGADVRLLEAMFFNVKVRIVALIKIVKNVIYIMLSARVYFILNVSSYKTRNMDKYIN